MTLAPPLTDWTFYAVAIPAVLLMGISKSGFGAGFGSLAVPLMALTISVPRAAAIFMPILLVADLMGLLAFRREVQWPLFRFLLPFSLLGTVVGTMVFHWVDPKTVAGIVGILTLAFLAQRQFFPPRAGHTPPRWWGALMGVTGGFTSFVSHAGGPPINAYVIPLRLPPLAFTATMAYLFFAINLSKWIPYAWLGLLDAQEFATSLVLLPLVPVGVWVGIWLARRIEITLFYRIISVGMLLTGLKLVWDGFLHG